MSFPTYRQYDAMDCGPTCLRMITKYYGKSLSLQFLRQKCQVNRAGVSLLGICDAAESIGLRTLPVKVDFEKLQKQAVLPFIAHWKQNHFVVVYKISASSVYIADPAKGRIKLSKADFLSG